MRRSRGPTETSEGGSSTDLAESECDELHREVDELEDEGEGELDAELEGSWPKPQFSWPGLAACAVSDFALDTFFSRVEVVNAERVPSRGPVILFGNHSNQFVDGMVMMRAARRPVSYVAAKVSYDKPVIGDLLKALDAVPVVRPQDLATVGPGALVGLDLETRTLRGRGTAFQSLASGCLVGNAHVGQFMVESVASDTELTFKPLKEDHVVTCEQIAEHGATYKVTPHVEHNDMFESVFASLAKGRCIGIFPEGGSHDRTALLPLKAGTAMMALGARSRGIPVTLVPVGINYFSGHVFRSKVFVDVGKAVTIPASLSRLYETRAGRREATSQLLSKMQQALDLVCLTAPDFDTLKAMRTARRMYQGKVELSAREYIDLNLRFSSAFELWKERPEFQAMMRDVHEYLERARSQGLTDKQVRDLPPQGSLRTAADAVVSLVGTICLTGVLLPLAAPGMILYAPLMLYSRVVVPREMRRALAKSSVKIHGRDVAASQQIMLGLKLIPVLHVVYSIMWGLIFVAAWPLYGQEPPGTWVHLAVRTAPVWLPLCFFFMGPFYCFRFTPSVGERLVRRWRLFPRYALCVRSFFSSTERGPAEELRQERKRLALRVQKLVEKLVKEQPEWRDHRVIDRAKVLKSRSRSIRALASKPSGELLPRLQRLPEVDASAALMQ